jgi:hypothetical protein
MKRIVVLKNETVTELVERVLADTESKLVLVVPKGAKLKASADSFALLAREAAAAGKEIVVESVDEEILELAVAEKLTALHPLLSTPESRERVLSDIVPAPRVKSGDGKNGRAKEALAPKEESVAVKPVTKVAVPPAEQITAAQPRVERVSAAKPIVGVPAARKRIIGRTEPIMPELPPAEATEAFPKPTRRMSFLRRFRAVVVVLALILIVGGVAWAAGLRFGRAAIDVSFRSVPWQYQGTIVASKAASTSTADASGGTIPAEVFSDSRNLTKLFPATGKSQANQKATGKLTIYNAYSTASQQLVATTRFATPDGKIFRLNAAVVVPGAKQKNGALAPSTIVADVTADKPGEAYNLGVVQKLTIPGFKGTPKYDGFYGALLEGTSGGSTAATAAPTAQDIAGAKQKVADILNSSLENSIQTTYARDFTILGGASSVAVTKLNVNQMVDKDGDFSVFSEAQVQAIGFRESDLENLLLGLAGKDNPGLTFRNVSTTYANVEPDFENGRLTLSVTAQGTLAPPFSADAFKASALGQGIGKVRGMLAAIPGVTEARLSLWPFWLASVPSDAKRVTVTVH